MREEFHVTAIGHSHIRSGKPCQDFSACYSDSERTIITACDGHGGKLYVRSERGSRFASDAAVRMLQSAETLFTRNYTPTELEHALKLNILCEWNRLVTEDLDAHPLRKNELTDLNEAERATLRENPAKAYGSTLCAAMLYNNRLLCVSLGDGGAFLLRGSDALPVFGEDEDEDEPVANVTYSLCDEHAFDHMKAKLLDARRISGVLLCTDGILTPYQSIKNFKQAFILPVVHRVAEGKTREVKQFVEELGCQSGVGDDVSLAMIWQKNTRKNRSL